MSVDAFAESSLRELRLDITEFVYLHFSRQLTAKASFVMNLQLHDAIIEYVMYTKRLWNTVTTSRAKVAHVLTVESHATICPIVNEAVSRPLETVATHQESAQQQAPRSGKRASYDRFHGVVGAPESGLLFALRAALHVKRASHPRDSRITLTRYTLKIVAIEISHIAQEVSHVSPVLCSPSAPHPT